MLRLRILLPGLLAASTVFAGDPASLAELLPPQTPVYIEAKNPSLEEIKGQAIWKCMQEPALKRALERMFSGDAASQAIPLGSGALFVKVDPRDSSVELRFVDRKGSHSLKMGDRFGFAWIGMADGPLPIDAVLAFGVANPGEAIGTVKRIIAAVSASFHPGKRTSTDTEMERLFTTATHREQEYTKVAIDEVTLYIASLGKMLFLATTEARMRESIDRLKDGPGASLAATKRFKDTVAAARGTGSTTTVMIVQIDKTLDALAPQMAGPIGMLRGGMAKMGLAGLKTMSSVSRIDGVGISNTMSLILDRQPGAPLLKTGKPTELRSLTFAPKDTFYVNCLGINPDTLSVLLKNPAAVGMFAKMFGLRLKEDLLDLIGDELGIIIAPNQGLIPDLGLVLHSTDAKRLEKTLLKITQSIPWPAGTAMHHPTIRGVTAHVMPLMHPQFGTVPLAPTFGVVGDQILIAPSPIAFQRFVAVSQGAKANINANRDFAKLREMVPENAASASYLNLPRMVGFFYDTFVPFLQSIPQPKGNTAVYELPESEVFTKHLYGRIAWTLTDDRGWHWVSHAPMDMSGFMIAGAVFAGVALYFVSPAEPTWNPMPPPKRDHDHEALNCGANVRMLAARLRFYRRQNKEFPATLDDIKAEYLPEDTFVVPGTDKAYVYFGTEGKGSVLLHGYPNGRDKRICVLTRRMRVMRVSGERLKKMLSTQSVTRRAKKDD